MTRTADIAAIAIVRELAATLAQHDSILCHPTIEEEDGLWTLSVTFRPTTNTQALEVLELMSELRKLQDLAQLRGLAERYHLDPVEVETWLDRSIKLPPKPATLSVDELTEIVAALEDPMMHRDRNVDTIASALLKLQAMLTSEIF